MTEQEKMERKAENSIGKEIRVCVKERKVLSDPSVFFMGLIEKAEYIGKNKDGNPQFSIIVRNNYNRQYVVVKKLP